ncbi:glycosyltransferase family 2 protein [candidate division KSB1 bacterium]|nr:glycosyltransferase family 2 protein [candidate division KSB1 bacterium]
MIFSPEQSSGDTPRVSVVLPVFNRDHLVQRAIDSVLAQTFTQWELLIVDDGSTDGLERRALPLVMNHSSIRYLKHANRKLSASRNIGIHAALGEWVTFLDSDDAYRPQHLQLRVEYIDSHPQVDILHGGVELVGPPETHYVQDAFSPDRKIHIADCAVGATFFGRKSVFIATGGFPRVPYSAESAYLPRLEARFCVERVDFPTYLYYTGLPDSICALRQQGDTPLENAEDN